MTKVLSGVMGIVMTGAVVTASAYALFTASATVNGINFSTGSVALEVSGDGTNFASNLPAGINIVGATPGFGVDLSENAQFFLRNSSTEGSLDVEAQLTAATGWGDNNLKDYVEVAVVQDLTPEDSGDDVAPTTWYTLAQWNAEAKSLVTDLDSAEVAAFDAYVRMVDAPNSEQNKSLTDITFTFTGESAVIEE